MERVMVISFYDDMELDLSVEKEQQLKEYCKIKKYQIENMFREPQYYDLINNVSNIYYYLEQCIKGNHTFDKIDKIIIYSIDEITSCEEDIVMCAAMFNIYNVKLETIKEGILGKDLKYWYSIEKDNNVLEENKQFIICEDLPF